MKRDVKPEILDELSESDPRAIRSRKDLRLINYFMRGEAWILSRLESIIKSSGSVCRVVELGAGEALLSQKISERFPDCDVVAIDLVDRPKHVPDKIMWESVNVLNYDVYDHDTVVVANLFIHHLEDGQIRQLAERLKHVRTVVFAEPHRSALGLFFGRLIFPIINDVTRHDMLVSIRAGFCGSEIPALFGSDYQWKESYGLFGGLRIHGTRFSKQEEKGS